MDALDAIRTRRSVRTYERRPVPRELLEEVVDCARLAATARNVQPWAFVVVTSPAGRAALAEAAVHNGPFIADAGACVVVLCEETKYYLEDGSAAVQNLLVAARARGLGSCWVAGDKKPYADAVRRLVGAPDTHRLVALVPVGWPAEHPSPAKKPLAGVLHWERFGGAPPVL
jgi:nitroreductase